MSLWQTRDGLWRMRYYAAGTKRGRRVQDTLPKGTTAAEARREYRIRLGKAARRQAGPSVSLTFREAGEEYVATQGPKMSEAGRGRAESILEQHLLPAFGERRIDSPTQADIERYQNERRAKPQNASPATVNRETNVLRAVLNKAEAWGLIDRIPFGEGRSHLSTLRRGRRSSSSQKSGGASSRRSRTASGGKHTSRRSGNSVRRRSGQRSRTCGYTAEGGYRNQRQQGSTSPGFDGQSRYFRLSSTRAVGSGK